MSAEVWAKGDYHAFLILGVDRIRVVWYISEQPQGGSSCSQESQGSKGVWPSAPLLQTYSVSWTRTGSCRPVVTNSSSLGLP